MDRTGIIVVAICAILFVGWVVEEQKYQSHLPPPATNAAAAQTEAANPPIVSPAETSIPIFDTNTPEKLIVITNADARYTFTSRGGGLKSVELVKYPETVSARWKKEMATNGVATLNTHAPVPILAILGDASFIGDGNFTLTQTGDGVRAEKSFSDGLILTKIFSISSNYLINASVSLTNSSARPLVLPAQEWVVGTATPMGLDDSSFYIYGGAMWFDGTNAVDKGLTYFNTNTTSFFGMMQRTPTPEYRAGAGDVVWAATHNQYFVLLAMLEKPAQKIVARPVSLSAFVAGNQPPNMLKGVQTALVYPAQTLTANSSVERKIVFFAGPKEYRTLARVGEEFNNRADLVMNFGTGYASFFGIGSFCAKALLLAMNWIHDGTTLGYGWAIVLLTIILRGIFWPLTAVSMRSSKKMQALAPEVKALKEKYKDDPQKFTQKQMELWKKNKVNPMGGCLPMLVQMPVFIGFYTMLRSAIELRGAHFLWVADLSKPDTLFMIPGLTFIPIICTPEGLPFNLLPLLMVGVMIWQAHLMPASPGMDPGQQKMMRFMPLMFLLFFYNYASGMALYMTVSTLSSVLQTKLTKMNQVPAAVSPLTPVSKRKK